MLSVLSGTVLMLTIGVLLIFFVSWQFFSHKVRATLPLSSRHGAHHRHRGRVPYRQHKPRRPHPRVYTAFRGWEQKNALATTSMYFNFVNASIIVMQRKAGLYSSAVYDAVSISLTFAVIGVLISIPVVRRMPQETFRKLLLLMIFISGVTLLSRSVM